MKKVLTTLGLSALLATGASALPVHDLKTDYINYVSAINQRTFQTTNQWRNGRTAESSNLPNRLISEVSPFSEPSSFWGSLYTPDGTEWMYTIDYNWVPTEVSYINTIETATITIYDDKFAPVKTFDIDFELGENETSINSVQIAPTLSKKFFDINEAYEVMVYVHATTEDYTGHSYTKIYTLSDGGYVTTIEGNVISCINNVADSWSENYTMVFMKENVSFTEEGYAKYLLDFNVYSKAGWDNGCQLEHTFEVDYDYISGAGNYAMPFLVNMHNRKLYYALPRYEKPYFVDFMSEDINPDNHFMIDLYDSNFNLIKTTSIPMEVEEGTLFSFPGLGELYGNKDIDFELFSNGVDPMYIVGVESYVTASDDFTSSLYVYDTDGNLVKTIVNQADDYMKLTDIVGSEEQFCFYFSDDLTGGYFKFIDLPSGNEVATVPMIYEGEVLSMLIDRTQIGKSYKYLTSMSYADVDEEENTYHRIAWFNADGSFDRIDKVNLGKDVALAQVYISGSAADPYLFNTDDLLEYMFLVKEYISSESSATKEYLRIYNTDGDMLINLGAKEETDERLNTIYLTNISKTPSLMIAYYGNDKYTLHNLTLPLTQFAGGDGTQANPYIIATAGDFKAIKNNPAGYYKLNSDLDFNNKPWKGTEIEFTGNIDGCGHTVSNLYLNGNGIFDMITGGSTVKDLTFENVTVKASDTSGILASSLSGSVTSSPVISNVHFNGVVAEGDSYCMFGAVAGMAAIRAEIKDCSVTGATFSFGEEATVGGILGRMLTGCALSNCLFDGNITACVVGGIVGSSFSGDETISNCHTNVNIHATEIAGGILGDSGRSAISNCFVEGSIHVLGSNEVCAGGIAGKIQTSYSSSPVMVVENCISSAKIYTNSHAKGIYAHRIAGFTSGDEWLVDWESNDPNVDWGDPETYPYIQGSPEYKLNNNYGLDLAVVDSNVEDKENSAEGKSLSAEELTDAFLAEHNWALGNDASAPWKRSLSPLALYFEGYALSADQESLNLTDENKADGTPAILTFTSDRRYADLIKVESKDPSVAEIVSATVSADGYSLICEVCAVGNGQSEIVATLGDVEVVVMASTTSSIASVATDTDTLSFDGKTVNYGNAPIMVYNMSGVLVAKGNGSVSVENLSKGVYVAVSGNRTLKFAK